MPRIVPLLVLALLGSTSHAQAWAQPPAGGQAGSTARALLALENGWASGVVRRDTALFQRMLHPRFVYTEDAVVMNKADLIKAIRDGDRVETAANSDMIVHDHGNTAIVTGILRMTGRAAAGPFDRRYRFTDVWLRRDGRWRMIAAQDYLIPR